MATGPGVFDDGGRRDHIVFGGPEKATLVLAVEASDGLAISNDVVYDAYSGTVVGLADTTDADFLELLESIGAAGHLTSEQAEEFARNHEANTEAVVFFLCTSNGVFSSPVGIYYTTKSGGREAVRKRHEAMQKQYKCCLECLKKKDWPLVSCAYADGAASNDKCISCKEQNLRCVRLHPLVWTTDRAGKMIVVEFGLSCGFAASFPPRSP